MVGHMNEDINQVFATISAHLKQIHFYCPDQPSLFNAIRNAFSEELDKPLSFELSSFEIVDYTSFYTDTIDSKIQYHQEPHQFRIKSHTIKNRKILNM